MEVIWLVVGLLIAALGLAIAERVISMEFFDNPGTVKMIKICTLFAYFGGMGAAIVGKVMVAVIGIALSIVGYLALNRLDPPKKDFGSDSRWGPWW